MIKKLYTVLMITTGIPLALGMLNLIVYMISGYSFMGEFDEPRMTLFMTYSLIWGLCWGIYPLFDLNE